RDRQNLTRLLTLEAVELAQAESLRLRSRQRRDAVGKDLPELLLFQRGIGVVPGRGLDAPMVAVGAVEELLEQAFALVVGGSGVRGTRFAGRSAPMVGELVLEDADEPGPFRRAAGKLSRPRQAASSVSWTRSSAVPRSRTRVNAKPKSASPCSSSQRSGEERSFTKLRVPCVFGNGAKRMLSSFAEPLEAIEISGLIRCAVLARRAPEHFVQAVHHGVLDGMGVRQAPLQLPIVLTHAGRLIDGQLLGNRDVHTHVHKRIRFAEHWRVIAVGLRV